jgi:polysaccharide export outer membrane protein
MRIERHILPLIICICLFTSCKTNTNSIQISAGQDKSYVIAGEVNLPGAYTYPKDSINVSEAIALAGDMTVFGKQNKVKVSRRLANGKIKTETLNMDKTDNLKSTAFFQVQPGDYIYVTPNKAKTESTNFGKKSTIWVSIASTLVSIGQLLIQKLKKLI